MPSLEVLRRAAAQQLAAVSEAPDFEARRLLEQATGVTGARLLIEARRPAGPDEAAAFAAALARRLAGEPLAYVLGRVGFHDIDLAVGPGVLIPRSDTETLVEAVLARLPAGAGIAIADLGTGSGAIALALAHARPRWRLMASDRDASALACATANARRLGLAERIEWISGDWLAPLAGRRFEAIVSNPPYIASGDPHLAAAGLAHEPRHALVAGADGLADLRRIIRAAPACLRPGGLLALEHGWQQGPAVAGLLLQSGFEAIATVADLAGRPRVTLGHAPAD